MVNPNGANSSVDMEFFTVRRSWAFESYGPYQEADGKGFWQWADVYPQAPGKNADGEIEQMVVMSGFWANGNGGRSNTRKYPYHSTEKFSYPRILGDNFEMHRVDNGTSAKGAGYQEQFDYAEKVDPDVILLVGWNEWKAGSQGLGAGMGQDIANTYVIDGNAPHYQFTDCFNPEFARDIEPMTGGYTDAFYYQTVNNVRSFKGVNKIPTKNDVMAIDINGDFSQWNSVETAYIDTPNDITHRNAMSAYLEGRYVNTSGRNDLRTAKVAYDNENVYFYIDTAGNITSPEGENWMNLFIDADKNFTTGWHGYDLLLNRNRDGSTVSVEYSNGGWSWQEIGRAEYKLGGNQLMIKLPNTLSNLADYAAFDFKWADNSTTDGTVEQFMDLGDAAPDNRFNFRVVQVAIGDTKAAIGLINGVEDKNPVWVEVPLSVDTTETYVDVSVTLKDNVYEIAIGGRRIAVVTLDESSIQSGHMELRRELTDGVMTPVYADDSVRYYTSGTIFANGTKTRFTGKAVAVADSATCNGTFGFSTRAETFWLKNVLLTELEDVSEPVLGDVNLDGELSVADLVLLQKYMLGTERFTEAQFRAGDMNSDGNTDVFDTVLMRRALLSR